MSQIGVSAAVLTVSERHGMAHSFPIHPERFANMTMGAISGQQIILPGGRTERRLVGSVIVALTPFESWAKVTSSVLQRTSHLQCFELALGTVPEGNTTHWGDGQAAPMQPCC
ncbi:MAG TPA: hypothetical protein VGJ20_36910 [Xanthobacteraceae bacterium]|jgi:hypothetical protein